MQLSFLGAAREVTGSCYLVETADTRFLVDCGMVQGGREAPARNRKPFAFDPKSNDFELLTHAHIDHSGQLPKLTRAGFQGPIYTTAVTTDLLQAMLPDSAHIQEGDVERAKCNNKSAHDRSATPTPLYTMQDARDCLRQVRPIAYDQELTPHPVVRCRLRDAGHILGSAIIEAWVTDHGQTTKLVFSGDLGQPGRPILRDPTPIEEADILLMESTYGDRTHKDLAATENELIGIVERTLHEQEGNVIVQAFAVGRTQVIQDLLGAADRGAFEAGARSIGLNVTLPHEQEPNPFISPELAFRFRYFALRKMHFLLRARALVAFPGGYGTLDELFEVLTLVQTGKMARIPIVLFGGEFWRHAVNFYFLIEEGIVSAADTALFTVVEKAEEAIAVLHDFYQGKPP